MKFYIKEWNDQTVSLMTEQGNVLAYFSSISEALAACNEWYMYNNNEPRHEVKIHSNNLTQQYNMADIFYAA